MEGFIPLLIPYLFWIAAVVYFAGGACAVALYLYGNWTSSKRRQHLATEAAIVFFLWPLIVAAELIEATRSHKESKRKGGE